MATLPTRREAIIGIGAVLTLEGATKAFSANTGAEPVDVKAFGAKGDGNADDNLAIRAAHDHAKRREAPLMFPAGRYQVTGWKDQGNEPIRWFSREGASIRVSGPSLEFGSVELLRELRGLSPQDQRILNVDNSSGIISGAVLHVTARKVVDRYRGDPIACQTALVRAVSPAAIELDEPLNFSFSDQDDVARWQIFNRPRIVEFEGLEFITAAGNTHGRAVTVFGLKGGTPFRNCSARSEFAGDVNKAPSGFMLHTSIGAAAESLDLRDCCYGYMIMRGSRDCSASHVVAEGTRHAISPGYWAYRCAFDHIVGQRNVATLDSHSAFDISYRDVDVRDDLEMSNIRSAGATLIDAVIRTRSKARAPSKLTIAPQVWMPDYGTLTSRHDVVLRNVSLLYEGIPPSDGYAVAVGGARSLSIDNLTTKPGGLRLQLPEDGSRVRLRKLTRTTLTLD